MGTDPLEGWRQTGVSWGPSCLLLVPAGERSRALFVRDLRTAQQFTLPHIGQCCLFVCLFVCLFACLPVCLFVCLFVCYYYMFFIITI